MASVLKVDKLDPQSGTALEIGTSGDTITVPSGATFAVSGTMNASSITAGTVATARLGSGTASSSTILYGDQTYKTAPSSTLVKIETKNVTSNTSTIDFTDGFSSTYENYFMIVSHCVPETDDASLYMRWLNVSGAITSTSYNFAVQDYDNGGTDNSFYGANTTFLTVTRGIDTDNAEVGRATFTAYIMTPQTTDHPPEFLWHASYRNVTSRAMAVGSGTCNEGTAITGIQFYASADDIAKFTGTLYGIVE